MQDVVVAIHLQHEDLGTGDTIPTSLCQHLTCVQRNVMKETDVLDLDMLTKEQKIIVVKRIQEEHGQYQMLKKEVAGQTA